MATHSSILAWEILRTEGPGGLQSTGLQRVGHDLATKQHSQWRKTESFSLKIRNKTRMPLPFNTVLEILAKRSQTIREIKYPQTGNKEEKLSLFKDGMMLYVETLRNHTKKALELIKMNLTNFKGIKSMCKHQLYFNILAVNNPEKEIQKTCQFINPCLSFGQYNSELIDAPLQKDLQSGGVSPSTSFFLKIFLVI